MISLFILRAALAAEPSVESSFVPLPPLQRLELSDPYARARLASKPSGQKGSGQKGSSKGGSGGKRNKQENKRPHWEQEPYIQPGGGVQVYSQNGKSSTVATLSADAGVTYAYVNAGLPQWGGYSRLRGVVMASGDTSQGLELRAGSFFGPHWKVLGLQSGLDLFWNRWSYGSQTLDPSLGAEVPVIVSADLDKVSVYGGVAASWLQEESRRVDWDEQTLPGFGHEFAYLVGASGRIAGVKVGLNAQYRITAAGPVTSGGLTAGVDSKTLPEILDVFGKGSGGSGSGGASEGGGRK